MNTTTGGFANTATGFQTLFSNATGSDNLAVGNLALISGIKAAHTASGEKQ